MKIYVAHARGFDYKNELYLPLRESPIDHKHQIIFPNETEKWINSKEIIRHADIVIAEVSYASIGLGIELGWASLFNVPIVCLIKAGIKPSESLSTVTETVIPYSSIKEMVRKIGKVIL